MGWELFGEALRERRAQTGLSQRALAARAGVSERSVRNIESGAVQRPQRDVACRLAEAVGLDLSVLPAGNGAALRIGVLGPFVVEAGTEPADVGPAKQQALLGLLALQPGVAVSTEEIIDAVWGENPPASSVNLVHTYSSRLRRALESYGSAVHVVSTQSGYRLLADAESLDLWRFRDLVDRAARADDPQVAVDLYEQALDCWRGRIVADLPAGIREHPAAVAVAERQLAVALAYADFALGIGRHAAVVERIRPLAQRHELHEGLHARLILAAAGSGQQAAALRVFDDIRRRLDEELGVQPGAELRDAHLRVLRGDVLAAVAPDRPGRPKPAQLPADVPGFVGREDDLAQLDAMLDRTPADHGPLVISSIDGMPGIGKTALAVHWAHRVAHRFPDGQLFINLRGYDRSTPVQPQQALARFLTALGLPADQIPADDDEAAGLYRTQLAGRRVLVVLDNASSVEQIRSLLPGTSTCLVVVTSRGRLADLAAVHGAQRLSLDVLEPDDAQALVAGMIGVRRAEEESRAVKELTRSCGYVPLVLRVAAANLSARPQGSASDYVAEIRERRVADGDTVRAAFDLSFERLDPTARRVFRLLGLTPAEIVPDAVAALADCTTSDARAVLHQLCAVSLLQEYAAGRFRLHDLLRGYAAARADDLDAGTRTAAAARMLDFYLRSVDAATRLLFPNALRMPLPDVAEPAREVSFTSEDAALAWLDAERSNVLEVVTRAAQLGVPEYSWRLVDALRGYVRVGGYSDGMSSFEAARSNAKVHGDQLAEASVLDVCGLLQYNVSAFQQSVVAHSDALAISRKSGNLDIEAESLQNLGRAYAQIGTMADAASCLEQAIAIQRRLGDVVGEASTLSYLGTVALSQADLTKAAELGARVLELSRSTGDRFLEVRGLSVAARASWSMGRLNIATRTLAECIDAARMSGNRTGELSARLSLAENLCDLGQFGEAEEQAVGALTLGRSLGERRQESGCLEMLAMVRHQAGNKREAEVLFDEALRQARQVQFRFGEMSVLIGLGDLYRDTGRPDEAMSSCQAALELMRDSGYVLLEARALTGLALACAEFGRIDLGADQASQAVGLAHERGQRLAEARALRALGQVRRMQGDAKGARRCREQAMSIFVDIGTPEAAQLRNLLANAAAS